MKLRTVRFSFIFFKLYLRISVLRKFKNMILVIKILLKQTFIFKNITLLKISIFLNYKDKLRFILYFCIQK